MHNEIDICQSLKLKSRPTKHTLLAVCIKLLTSRPTCTKPPFLAVCTKQLGSKEPTFQVVCVQPFNSLDLPKTQTFSFVHPAG